MRQAWEQAKPAALVPYSHSLTVAPLSMLLDLTVCIEYAALLTKNQILQILPLCAPPEE